MSDLRLGLDEPESRIDRLIAWMPRVAVAVIFGVIGADKFAAHSMWVGLFDQIGLGDWFRYFTGGVQILGAVMVLVPRVVPIGILLLGGTMAGAVITWVFALHAPGNAVIPAIILVALAIVGVSSLARPSREPPRDSQ